MKHFTLILLCLIVLIILAVECHSQDMNDLKHQNEILFQLIQDVHHPTAEQMEKIRAIFARSGYIGQGNPSITAHPITQEQCEEKINEEGIEYENPVFEKICGSRYMAPLYNPDKERPEDACACIDQFEFPNIPCVYPVVWVRAKEAAQICEALGKRLCDAHEWEGACAGALEDPDYRFDLAAGKSPEQAIRLMRDAHNKKYAQTKSWSYGPEYKNGICAASSRKTSG